ncbi:MAG: 2-hydroxyglutaryl-CoA dehydratase [Firmicutes bacterium]|nr:2-hydroxyglutaryl-CoA dehydratase [Bacillota bacterium]
MKKQQAYLGVDLGSVSTNLVLLEPKTKKLLKKVNIRTQGKPMQVLQQGMKQLLADEHQIVGVGTTGSARELAGVMLGADVIKNEITAHAIAAANEVPDVRTILEIGGQDSKIIILKQGVVVDFAMNTVCAAGTGSFLDQQAGRLNIPIDKFGDIALVSKTPVRIAGRCTVFAESDMIHKQQLGHSLPDILAGLCQAMVRNYVNNLGKGKDIQAPVVFQGGVAANKGMRKAFQEILGMDIYVPQNHDVMGAIGAAILAEEYIEQGHRTKFYGQDLLRCVYSNNSFECTDCPNHCEIVNIYKDQQLVASWGARCGKSHASLSTVAISRSLC